jgi:hypothetical protein
MQLMRKLAANRLNLDRCVEHPDYHKEAMQASSLFLETRPLSARLDRLVNDIHFTARNQMLYAGYSNALRQLQSINTANPQENAKKANESIASACDLARINAIKAQLHELEKQIQPLLR